MALWAIAESVAMPRPVSPMPQSFASDNERKYWHSAQDIAYRAGVAILDRDGASWLVSEQSEQLLCRPPDPRELWYRTWLALSEEYPRLSRLWVRGRAITKPGE